MGRDGSAARGIRCATGEGWNGLMHDAMARPELGECSEEAGDCGSQLAREIALDFFASRGRGLRAARLGPASPNCRNGTAASTPLSSSASSTLAFEFRWHGAGVSSKDRQTNIRAQTSI